MIKCSECGYENMDGLDYCDGCGAKLQPVAAQAAGSASSQPAAAPTSSPSSGAADSASTAQMATAGTPAAAEATAPESQSGLSTEPSSNEHIAVVPEPPSTQAPTGEIHAGEPTPEGATEAAAAPFKAKLSIIRGGRRGQEFELESGNNLVGRWDPETGAFPEVDLDADDPEAKVSRKHALIRIDAGKITIEDIGSLNGTYVNRQPRLQPGTPLTLKDGDEIIIGKTFLKLAINPIS
jgi:hypothetical protein